MLEAPVKLVHSLAIGALYSSRRHPAIQDSPSDFFGARTRLYLEMEMDRPTMATTQAAVILSAFESANGRDSRGQFSFSR
jgi:hypothetical protein